MDKFLKFECEDRTYYISLKNITAIAFADNICSITDTINTDKWVYEDLIPNAEKAFFDFITNAYGFGEGSDVLTLKKMPELEK